MGQDRGRSAGLYTLNLCWFGRSFNGSLDRFQRYNWPISKDTLFLPAPSGHFGGLVRVTSSCTLTILALLSGETLSCDADEMEMPDDRKIRDAISSACASVWSVDPPCLIVMVQSLIDWKWAV